MMNNNRAYQLFCKATARTICHMGNCTQCHGVFGTTLCPADIEPSDKEMHEFISKVAHLLRDWGDDMPFTPDITEEEITRIFINSAGEGEV